VEQLIIWIGCIKNELRMKIEKYINKFNIPLEYGTRKLEECYILQHASCSSEISVYDSFLVPKSYEGVEMFSFLKQLINYYQFKKNPDTTIKKVLNKFYYWLLTNGLSETTSGYHYHSLKRFFRDTNTINPSKDKVFAYIQSYFWEQNKSKSHLRNFCTSMDYYYKYIGKNTTFPKPKKSKRIIREILSEEEIKNILETSKPDLREYCIALILAYSGIRNSELCNLNPSDIRKDRILIRSGKGDKDGFSIIPEYVADKILKYINVCKRNQDESLFKNVMNDNRIKPERVRKIIKKIARKANIEKRVYPHLFRHALASNLIYRGMDIYFIQQQLRHENIQTTTIYLKSNPQKLNELYNIYCPNYIQ